MRYSTKYVINARKKKSNTKIAYLDSTNIIEAVKKILNASYRIKVFFMY